MGLFGNDRERAPKLQMELARLLFLRNLTQDFGAAQNLLCGHLVGEGGGGCAGAFGVGEDMRPRKGIGAHEVARCLGRLRGFTRKPRDPVRTQPTMGQGLTDAIEHLPKVCLGVTTPHALQQPIIGRLHWEVEKTAEAAIVRRNQSNQRGIINQTRFKRTNPEASFALYFAEALEEFR